MNRRTWSHAENNLIAKLYEDCVKPAQIAARMGASRNTIETKLKSWGVERKFRDDGDK